ncbi:anther-specific proline-rich protein APG-like [Zea mays]|nr:anther-specific proline-rich protein APG-like [Zea mays]
MVEAHRGLAKDASIQPPYRTRYPPEECRRAHRLVLPSRAPPPSPRPQSPPQSSHPRPQPSSPAAPAVPQRRRARASPRQPPCALSPPCLRLLPRPPETRQVSLPYTARSTIGAPFPGEPQPSTFLATGDLPSLALSGEPTPPPHGCPPDPSPVRASAPSSATHRFSPTSPMAWTATSLTLHSGYKRKNLLSSGSPKQMKLVV